MLISKNLLIAVDAEQMLCNVNRFQLFVTFHIASRHRRRQQQQITRISTGLKLPDLKVTSISGSPQRPTVINFNF